MSRDPDPRPTVEIHAYGATWPDIVKVAEAEAAEFFRDHGDVELVDSFCRSLTVNDAPTGMHEGLLTYRFTPRLVIPERLPETFVAVPMELLRALAVDQVCFPDPSDGTCAHEVGSHHGRCAVVALRELLDAPGGPT